MPKLNGRIPRYRLHKASGQAIVTLDHCDHYLGLFGTAASRDEYDRLVNLWLAGGRKLPKAGETNASFTINHLLLAFLEHAKVYYRKADGTPTTELDNQRQALRPLRQLYGTSLAAEFGPKCLKSVREHMIQLGWCRTNINKNVSRVRSVFRWGVENELVPAEVHQALLAVRGLKRGRTTARESTRVLPAPEEYIRAIKPFVSRQVWALTQLQLLTAARAGELVKLRPVDVNTSAAEWMLEPEEHKTAHHGHIKRIYLGPQAIAVIKEFFEGRPVDAYLFSPEEAETERRVNLSIARRTSLSSGNRPGSNRKPAPARVPQAYYTVASYRRAISRACDLAYPPPPHLARQKIKGSKRRNMRWERDVEWKARLGSAAWRELQVWQREHRWHPHQLRHNRATQIRKQFGIEAARIILGVKSLPIAELYAEVEEGKARSIIKQIG